VVGTVVRAFLTGFMSLEIIGVRRIGRRKARPASAVELEPYDGDGGCTPMAIPSGLRFVGVGLIAKAIDPGLQAPAHVVEGTDVFANSYSLQTV
jgi:hypothetical protein